MRCVVPFLLALVVGAPSARAQDESQGDLFVLHAGSLGDALVDPKDQALRAALEMLGARIGELPGELGGEESVPPQALAVLGRLARGDFDLRAGFDASSESGFPPYAELALHAGSPRGAAALAAEIEGALAALGIELAPADARGLRPIDAPVPAWFGRLKNDFVLALGRTVETPLELGELHLPGDVRPAFAARLELGKLLALASDFAGDQPELADVVALFDRLGLGDARLTWALGTDAERSYAVSSVGNSVSALRESGLLPPAPLDARCIAVVPEDALWAVIGSTDLSGLFSILRELAADSMPPGSDPFEELAAETGFHLERDLLVYLDYGFGAFASDATGGGAASMVGFARVGDVDGLVHALGEVKSGLNRRALEGAKGYVAIRERRVDGVELSTLVFPGLPIPFEPSYAIAHGFLFAGLTPRAVAAAAKRAGSDSRGLAGRAELLEQLPEGLQGLYALTFVDTQRLLARGYGWASLGASALANAARSRTDLAREPGEILPSLAELARDAKACVTATRVVGDALVETTRADRSLVVNATAMAGFVDSLGAVMTLPGLLAGVAGAAHDVVEPRGSEFELELGPGPQLVDAKLAADLMALHFALAEYALFHDGVYPDELDELALPDESGESSFPDGLPVDPWGRAYRYDPPVDPSGTPRVYTLGRDGRPGGEGLDADVDNESVLARRKDEGR